IPSVLGRPLRELSSQSLAGARPPALRFARKPRGVDVSPGRSATVLLIAAATAIAVACSPSPESSPTSFATPQVSPSASPTPTAEDVLIPQFRGRSLDRVRRLARR